MVTTLVIPGATSIVYSFSRGTWGRAEAEAEAARAATRKLRIMVVVTKWFANNFMKMKEKVMV